MWLEASKVEDLWQKVSIKNGVQLKSFAEAARSTVTILDQVYGLGMTRADMFGNVDTLLHWCVLRPYSSLDEVLVEEIADKDRSTVAARIGDKKTVACASVASAHLRIHSIDDSVTLRRSRIVTDQMCQNSVCWKFEQASQSDYAHDLFSR